MKQLKFMYPKLECNDHVIIATNLFGNASAFEINSSTGELKNLWNYTVLYIVDSVKSHPPVCN